MSDHSNTHIHRSAGTSGRGLLIAFGLIAASVVLIGLVGLFAGGTGGADENAITPAGDGITAPAADPAPVSVD